MISKTKTPVKHLLSVLFILASMQNAQAASITSTDPSKIFWDLSGEIKNGDANRIATITNKHNIILRLDSTGGDVYEALRIGKILRKRRSAAMVGDHSNCLSACVFILAGAPNRIVYSDSSIGIHRMFSTDTSDVNYVDLDKQYKERKASIKSYLEEMNIPTELYEAIASTPPENIRFLTGDELTRYHLNIDDPTEEEIKNRREAKKYGLTIQDYLERKRGQKNKCSGLFPYDFDDRSAALKKLDQYDKCMEGVMLK